MNESLITLQGRVGSDVSLRRAGDADVASFRLACTPRRYQRKTDSWVDADTQWFTVAAWRGLAKNCDRSLRRGDAVVIHGRLNAQTWVNKAGVEVTTFEIDAVFVGHDLTKGTSVFTRPAREVHGPDGGEEAGVTTSADQTGAAA